MDVSDGHEREEGARQICTIGEVGDHSPQRREQWMRMQFEVKIMSLGLESLDQRCGGISRWRCPVEFTDMGLELRAECIFLTYINLY